MKKLIKKILKEEFEWIDDIQTNPAEEFLYEKFMECKLEPVEIGNYVRYTHYIDKTGKMLFIDDINSGKKNTTLYFDNNNIYQKLLDMGLNINQMDVLIKDVLYQTHKRKVDTTRSLYI